MTGSGYWNQKPLLVWMCDRFTSKAHPSELARRDLCIISLGHLCSNVVWSCGGALTSGVMLILSKASAVAIVLHFLRTSGLIFGSDKSLSELKLFLGHGIVDQHISTVCDKEQPFRPLHSSVRMVSVKSSIQFCSCLTAIRHPEAPVLLAV